ncbi:E3 ubiquitin-protein ligase NEDD4-like [Orchesella cincta]|uniref:E3 ubiquitin-protein ligase NEDD4-like n=1 Tax=Orchesella cincta TaxID=48709 RepID=A0A1D2MBV5_ORCCI|nr:E3 ubiquitin-protein ligase NEDD4-like [Orchesella cincta]
MLAAASNFFGFSDEAVVEKAKLKFKVSGRNIKNEGLIGTSDPYVIVSLSEDGGKSKSKVGRTDTIKNQLNPDWSNEFEIKFDRKKDQLLYFHVWDDDRMRRDESISWSSLGKCC